MNKSSPHLPVLLDEVLHYISPQNGETYIDATFGAGGYSRGILDAAECNVYGIDRDKHVMEYASGLTNKYQSRFNFIQGKFGDIESIIYNHKMPPPDGIVFDIGVSSMQLDEAWRGFSFNSDAKLDMRMDNDSILSAHEVINQYSEKELSDILYQYGGERKSFKIAAAIIRARQLKRIDTTKELVEVILSCVGKYNDIIHPATRSFQAIRIEVNDELNQLRNALKGASNIIKKNGKIIVVTFHSLEDEIVKEFFANLAGKIPNVNRHLPPLKVMDEKPNYVLMTRKVVTPKSEEIKNNPRSRSAKLRAIMRVS